MGCLGADAVNPGVTLGDVNYFPYTGAASLFAVTVQTLSLGIFVP